MNGRVGTQVLNINANEARGFEVILLERVVYEKKKEKE